MLGNGEGIIFIIYLLGFFASVFLVLTSPKCHNCLHNDSLSEWLLGEQLGDQLGGYFMQQ